MAIDLLMPKLGLTMQEGTLTEWKVAPGQKVRKGEVLYVVETEKVATDIEAEADGVFLSRIVAEGETVPVGAPVGRMASSDGTLSPARDPMPAPDAPRPGPSDSPGPFPGPASTRRIVATPLARRIARERGVELTSVSGSGPRGRIKAADVERAAGKVAPSGRVPEPSPQDGGARSRPSPTQASMARRLAEVKQGVPHFYLSTEVEVSALLKLRAELNADTELPRLTLTHFLIAAVGRALCDLPNMNRIWSNGELVTYSACDVGMAVETDGGLFVPVVRDAGTRGVDGIAASARDLIDRAKAGQLRSSDMTGAATSISNAGMHDVTWLTSIINPGQSSILGVGSVREIFRPDENGAPALRREIGIVFSGDHRVHTGVEGLAFLNRVKAYLEKPMRLLRHPQSPDR